MDHEFAKIDATDGGAGGQYREQAAYSRRQPRIIALPCIL
jgi:hypothetical protein